MFKKAILSATAAGVVAVGVLGAAMTSASADTMMMSKDPAWCVLTPWCALQAAAPAPAPMKHYHHHHHHKMSMKMKK